MTQPDLFSLEQPDDTPQGEILTVSQVAEYLSALLREDALLGNVSIVGEVSNPVLAKSGHFYFSIKDEGATMSCVMWRSAVRQLFEPPKEGDRVILHGRVDLYAPRGQLQIVVDSLRVEGGIGDLYREFDEIKQRLQAEGLFDPARKRPLPALPRRIAVVTSATGAALRDILRVFNQRWPLSDVLLVPSLVQGAQAPAALQAALTQLYKRNDIDVILLARGGGSIEDLWAFNDEGLARLIAESPLPVVSGVGHETDFTIIDFVADLRAPTPSSAAASISPDQQVYRQHLQGTMGRLAELMQANLERRRVQIERTEAVIRRHSPQYQIDQQRLRMDDLERRLSDALDQRLQRLHWNLQANQQRLSALNPTAVLDRGYAIVRSQAGQIIRSQTQVQVDERLRVQVADGHFPVSVIPSTPTQTEAP